MAAIRCIGPMRVISTYLQFLVSLRQYYKSQTSLRWNRQEDSQTADGLTHRHMDMASSTHLMLIWNIWCILCWHEYASFYLLYIYICTFVIRKKLFETPCSPMASKYIYTSIFAYIVFTFLLYITKHYVLTKNSMPNSSCEFLPCDLKGFFPTEKETSISRNTLHACPEGGRPGKAEREGGRKRQVNNVFP